MADNFDNQRELYKQVREHAWSWFALHAGQRMQSFNFFLIATAFLVASYATLLEKNPTTAAAVAIIGALLAFFFQRLEMRTRQLIHGSEDALKAVQQRLADELGLGSIRICERVQKPDPGTFSYRTVIGGVEWIALIAFLAGALYALSTKFTDLSIWLSRSLQVDQAEQAGPIIGGIANTVGLVLTLAGVLLLFRYGMPFRVETTGYSILMEGNVTSEDRAANRRYRRLGNLGLAFVCFGTAAQILGAWN